MSEHPHGPPESREQSPARREPPVAGPAPKPRGTDDPEVRAWVSRFTGGEGPPQIGSRIGLAEHVFLPASEMTESQDPAGGESSAGDSSPGAAGPARRIAAKRSRALPELPSARAARVHARWLTIGAVALGLIATAVILLPRAAKVGGSRISTPATRVARQPTPKVTPPSGSELESQRAAAGPIAPVTPVRPPAEPVATPSVPAITTRNAAATPSTPATAAPLAPAPADTAVWRKSYGLEVATFIDRDRAVEERDQLLLATQLPARLLTRKDSDGFPTYRILLGSFETEAAAEHAANDLLAAGVVTQARIVVHPPRANPAR